MPPYSAQLAADFRSTTIIPECGSQQTFGRFLFLYKISRKITTAVAGRITGRPRKRDRGERFLEIVNMIAAIEGIIAAEEIWLDV